MAKHLHVGGLVAAGFDATGEFSLTISHSGRGVFSTKTWKKVARDNALAYPANGYSLGIGPIDGERIGVTEIDYPTGHLRIENNNLRIVLEYENGSIDIISENAE